MSRMESNARGHFISLMVCIYIRQRFIVVSHDHDRFRGSFLSVSETFKVILKDVYEFIWLEGWFDSRSNDIEESVDFLCECDIDVWLFVFINEIFGIVLASEINHSVVVCLRLEFLKLSSSLKSNIKNLNVKYSGLKIFRFLFWISAFSSVSLDEISIFRNLFSFLCESHFDERPWFLEFHFFDFSFSCLHELWFVRFCYKYFGNKISFLILISLRSFISKFSLWSFF